MKIRSYADLHLFFNKDEKTRYLKELEMIKQELLNNPVDLFVIAGDLCHKAYSIDHPDVPDIFNFVSDLVNIAKLTNTQIRIIKGTSSHDAKIVESLEGIYKNNKNIKIFSKPEIELIDGFSFRWLPESYGTEEEYEEFMSSSIMNRIVDMTFFHGSFKCAVEQWNLDWEANLPMSFIWDENRIMRNTKHFIVGGHIHEALTYYGKVFYINSYTSHNFGDKPGKGYMEFNLTKEGCTYKRCENNLAPLYITEDIYDIHKFDKDELRRYVNNIILNLDPNKARLRFRIYGLMNTESKSNIMLIKDITKNYNIKVMPKLSNNIVENKKIDTIDYSDRNIPITTKIYELYKELYGDINKEEIEKILQGER